MTSILKSNTNTNIYIDILSGYEYEYVQLSISILTCYFVLDAATGFALRLPNPGPRSTSSTRAPWRKWFASPCCKLLSMVSRHRWLQHRAASPSLCIVAMGFCDLPWSRGGCGQVIQALICGARGNFLTSVNSRWIEKWTEWHWRYKPKFPWYWEEFLKFCGPGGIG